ncbi:hypothetical protein [Arenibaculum pallidiluteum]|uniref:hypothetical protein n=1 Tax=Arenibaculum pallidiluteum TaxID=2812559 RepID=UPI001A97ACED|nr:hypothetical protein [Arenibaculum pallidiluteum]
MSKYEERVYISSGNAKKSIAAMRNQLAMLKRDVEQYSARKPGGPMVMALKEQIRKLEGEIADAEANKKREREARAAQDSEIGGTGEDGQSRGGLRSTSSRFPPRRRGP